MSGIARKMQRTMAKRAYRALGTAWNETKTHQASVLASGEKLPEGERALGTKPTLRRFIEFHEKRGRVRDVPAVPLAAALPKAEEKIDLSWDEPAQGATSSVPMGGQTP